MIFTISSIFTTLQYDTSWTSLEAVVDTFFADCSNDVKNDARDFTATLQSHFPSEDLASKLGLEVR